MEYKPKACQVECDRDHRTPCTFVSTPPTKFPSKEDTHEAAVYVAAVSAFFFGVADFFAAVFLGAAFFAGAAGFATLLVTRPDLVLPSTFGTSTTAGACANGVSVDSASSRG